MIPQTGASKGSSLAFGFRRGPCRNRSVSSVLLRLRFIKLRFLIKVGRFLQILAALRSRRIGHACPISRPPAVRYV